MIRADFMLSSPGHHVEMMLPVIAELNDPGRCRVLSLCELRGFDTPESSIRAAGAEVARLFPKGVRRSPSSGRQRGSALARALRRWVRALAWSIQIEPRLRRSWAEAPDVVVVPNDAGFPYDRIATAAARRGLPLVLVQEGIRFPLPVEAGQDAYGLGGADVLAAWGEASADYFRQRGVPGERIVVTGNPRFAETRLGSPKPVPQGPRLLLATNPIDDQGFCSTREKLELFDRFLTAVEPLVADDGLTLLVRWHRRESESDYEAVLSRRPWGGRVLRANDGGLSRALEESTAVVIVASTVGLEALAAGKPLGVLEIPGWGHVFDYVREGAAAAISWDADPTTTLRSLVAGADRADRERVFLERHLGPRTGAARAIAGLIRDLGAAA